MITNSEAGIVSDGSSCGSSKVCIQGVCLPLLQVSSPVHCPTNNLAYHCSGHGVSQSFLSANSFFKNLLNIYRIALRHNIVYVLLDGVDLLVIYVQILQFLPQLLPYHLLMIFLYL